MLQGRPTLLPAFPMDPCNTPQGVSISRQVTSGQVLSPAPPSGTRASQCKRGAKHCRHKADLRKTLCKARRDSAGISSIFLCCPDGISCLLGHSLSRPRSASRKDWGFILRLSAHAPWLLLLWLPEDPVSVFFLLLPLCLPPDTGSATWLPA